MGIINFFKKMFNKKVLTLPNKRRDILIQPFCSGYAKINIGQKLVVDEGWSAVIVAKDKVLDVFTEGNHELSLAYMPKTTKELKLDKGKVVKDGLVAEVVLPKSFKCDLYFIRTDHIQGRKWQSGLVKVREKDKKNLKYKMQGNYSFQVQAPDKAIKLFLIDWAKIKAGKAIVKLDYLVSEVCNEVLWDKKFASRKELTEYNFANTQIKPAVYKTFIKYGICITDMQVENIIYPQDFKEETFESVKPEKVQVEAKAQNPDTKEITSIESVEEIAPPKQKDLLSQANDVISEKSEELNYQENKKLAFKNDKKQETQIVSDKTETIMQKPLIEENLKKTENEVEKSLNAENSAKIENKTENFDSKQEEKFSTNENLFVTDNFVKTKEDNPFAVINLKNETNENKNQENLEIICSNCGAIIPKDSIFCNKCGKMIEKENENGKKDKYN